MVSVVAGWAAADFDTGLGQAHGENSRRGQLPPVQFVGCRSMSRTESQRTHLTQRGERNTSLIPVSDVICQIVSGELDTAIVARNEQVIAFLDHRPVFKGHVLVAPIRHVETLLDLPQSLMQPLLSNVQRAARAVLDALGAEGTFVAVNNIVSQSIPHLHVHVVPRTKGDGLRGFFWPRTRYAAGEIEEYAAKIKSAMENQ